MSQPISTSMTAGQLLDLPGDGRRYELVAGELRMMSPSGFEHGVVIDNVAFPLSEHVRRKGLGRLAGAETGFLIARDPDTVRAPDVAFVSAERIARSGLPRGYWPGAPDLAVEVVSPGDRAAEVEEKVLAWLAAGCREVWVVSPVLRSVTLYYPPNEALLLAGEDSIDRSRLLPEFRLPLADVFSGLDRPASPPDS